MRAAALCRGRWGCPTQRILLFSPGWGAWLMRPAPESELIPLPLCGKYLLSHEVVLLDRSPHPQGTERCLYLGEPPQSPGRMASPPAPPFLNRTSELVHTLTHTP